MSSDAAPLQCSQCSQCASHNLDWCLFCHCSSSSYFPSYYIANSASTNIKITATTATPNTSSYLLNSFYSSSKTSTQLLQQQLLPPLSTRTRTTTTTTLSISSTSSALQKNQQHGFVISVVFIILLANFALLPMVQCENYYTLTSPSTSSPTWIGAVNSTNYSNTIQHTSTKHLKFSYIPAPIVEENRNMLLIAPAAALHQIQSVPSNFCKTENLTNASLSDLLQICSYTDQCERLQQFYLCSSQKNMTLTACSDIQPLHLLHTFFNPSPHFYPSPYNKTSSSNSSTTTTTRTQSSSSSSSSTTNDAMEKCVIDNDNKFNLWRNHFWEKFDEQNCFDFMDQIIYGDNDVSASIANFTAFIYRYHCNLNEKIENEINTEYDFNCSSCATSYTKWICASKFQMHILVSSDNTNNGSEMKLVPPCPSLCGEVETYCPYFTPLEANENGGEPVFLCSESDYSYRNSQQDCKCCFGNNLTYSPTCPNDLSVLCSNSNFNEETPTTVNNFNDSSTSCCRSHNYNNYVLHLFHHHYYYYYYPINAMLLSVIVVVVILFLPLALVDYELSSTLSTAFFFPLIIGLVSHCLLWSSLSSSPYHFIVHVSPFYKWSERVSAILLLTTLWTFIRKWLL